YDAARAKLAADHVRAAGLADVVTVIAGDAFAEIPKLQGAFDFVFLDAWKRDYKRFLDLMLPRLAPRGLFLAHNVVNQQSHIRDIAKVCLKVYQTAAASLDEGAMPIVLGGDHSIAAGSVAAAAEWAKRTKGLPIGLLWIDAHGDMNTPATSLSGNVHGMPLAALLGHDPPELSSIGGFSPKVFQTNTVLIGVRNLDEREKLAVRESRIHVFTMNDIDRQGIASV